MLLPPGPAGAVAREAVPARVYSTVVPDWGFRRTGDTRRGTEDTRGRLLATLGSAGPGRTGIVTQRSSHWTAPANHPGQRTMVAGRKRYLHVRCLQVRGLQVRWLQVSEQPLRLFQARIGAAELGLAPRG